MIDKERIDITLGKLALYACTGAFDVGMGEISYFIRHFMNMEDRSEQVESWEARYNALLEEAESSRPHEYQGDGEDLPVGAIVLDYEKDAWQRGETGEWWCTAGRTAITLGDAFAPYTVIYTPEGDGKS